MHKLARGTGALRGKVAMGDIYLGSGVPLDLDRLIATRMLCAATLSGFGLIQYPQRGMVRAAGFLFLER